MIFEFKNYPDFIHAYLKSLPKKGHGESSRIAQFLGVSSTFVSHVLGRQKDFSLEQAELLTEYFGLSGLEAEYFLELVQLERAGTQRLKSHFQRKLNLLREQSKKLSNRLETKKQLTDPERAVFYSQAIFSAVHVFCSVGDKGKTLEEILQKFQLSRKKATEVIGFLASTSLVEEKNSHYRVGQMSTHLESHSPYLAKHHANWRLQAIRAAEDLDESELMYTSNVSLSEKDFGILRERMIIFIKDFLQTVHASPAEEVATLNLDFFKMRK